MGGAPGAAPPPGGPGGPPPPAPPPTVKQFDVQSFIAAIKLLKDDRTRGFRISIETDSTVLPDLQAQQKSRGEMIQAVGGILQSALPLADSKPALIPVIGDLILFYLRAFHIGEELEGKFEEGIAKLENNPAALDGGAAAGKSAEMQARTQEAQSKVQVATIDAQSDMMRAKAEIQRQQIENQGEAANAASEMQRAVIEEQSEMAAHHRALVQMHTQAALAPAAPLAPQKLAFGAGVLTDGKTR